MEQTVGQEQQAALRTSLSRLAVEFHRPLRVLLHPFALLHQPAQTAFGLRLISLSRVAVPAYRQLRILLHSVAKLIVLGQQGLAGRVPLEGRHAQPLHRLSRVPPFQPDPPVTAAGQQALGPGGAVLRRPAVQLHCLPGVRRDPDAFLITHRQVTQGRQASHLHRLLIEPDCLTGISLYPGALLQAQAQVARSPAAAQPGSLTEAGHGLLLRPVLLDPEHPQGTPVVPGHLLTVPRGQRPAAPGAGVRHGLPLAPEAAVSLGTVKEHTLLSSLICLMRRGSVHPLLQDAVHRLHV